MKNLYEVLGTSADATSDEIKKAYRKKAQETHPDLNKGPDTSDFEEVNFAYTILMNKQKRISYDRTGSCNDTVDNDKVNAIKELQRVILQLLENDTDDGIFYEDLLADVEVIFKNNIVSCKNRIVDHKKEMRRLRRFKKRFHYKGLDNNDFLVLAINRNIYIQASSISDEVKLIKSFELMTKLLTLYKYEPESLHSEGETTKWKTIIR